MHLDQGEKNYNIGFQIAARIKNNKTPLTTTYIL